MAQDVGSVLAKIRSGAIPPPSKPPAKCYAGKGTGRTCDGCGNIVTSDDVELEVDLATGGTLVFHRDCHGVWQEAVVGA